VSAKVYALAPYTGDHQGWTKHASDQVWTQQHGASGLLSLKRRGSLLAKGFDASITAGVDPSATPAKVGV
jgi:hypothetical protein